VKDWLWEGYVGLAHVHFSVMRWVLLAHLRGFVRGVRLDHEHLSAATVTLHEGILVERGRREQVSVFLSVRGLASNEFRSSKIGSLGLIGLLG